MVAAGLCGDFHVSNEGFAECALQEEVGAG